jgi:glycosyltransferase involved in cell wall biosynthesis
VTKASIVIPVFNRAHLVRRAIEVLLVDHGSTDEIEPLVRQYGTSIRYIRRDQDQGPAVAWRDGIAHATGEYVHITYDDDWISPQFMERCVAAFQANIGFVYTRAWLHRDDKPAPEPSVIHPPGVRRVDGLVQHLLRARFSLSPGCAVFRRADALSNLLLDVPGAAGPYGKRSGVGEDLLLFLLTTLDYPNYAHIPEHLADFYAHSGSITVGAIQEGRSAILAEAYDQAKEYYLALPAAHRPDKGWKRAANQATWIFLSRPLRVYSLKAWRRFT